MSLDAYGRHPDEWPKFSFSATVSKRVNSGIDYFTGKVGDALTVHFRVDESDPLKIGEEVLRVMRVINERHAARTAQVRREELLKVISDEDLAAALDHVRVQKGEDA